MEIVKGFVDKVRVATAHDSVYNSECCYTFFNDELFVNLNTFSGTTPAFAAPNSINLRILRVRRLKEAPADQPKKLAIGVEGGFDTEKIETSTTYSIVVVGGDPRATSPLLVDLPYSPETKDDFPERIQESAEAIINHAGVGLQQEVQAWQADDDEIPVSKYATSLPFVDNGIKIDPNPATWKCQKNGATENLWLNLSDGYIGGGRRNWDGSGGSNGALDHFEETGKLYPLVVKLGTLTADLDTADCYSYAPDEDGPVRIPNLAELLAKRGINIGDMQKTVKSTAELEGAVIFYKIRPYLIKSYTVELNANYAFDAITEAGEDLQVVSGPGLQGLQNLGNSCYMNSVFQMLLSGTVPELAHSYGGKDVTSHPFVVAASPATAPTDLLCQTAKLGMALTSGAYALRSEDDPNKYRIAPRMMKHCIGKDHVDFRTTQQQDASQFLQYFLEKLDQAEAGAGIEKMSSNLFSFFLTSRLQCSADSKVKYVESSGRESVWSLRIPMEKAVIVEEISSPDQKRLKAGDETKEDRKPVPTISLQTCIKEWGEPTVVDLRWAHLGDTSHPGKQTLRFSNFPRYLALQLQRYELGPDWTPVKLEVNVDVPQILDLNEYKTSGPCDGEDIIVEDSLENATASPKPSINETALSQLMDMGFSRNSCIRALNAVGGSDVEQAMGWVFEHNMDPDFNDPLPAGGDDSASNAPSGLDEAVVQSLVDSLGFTNDQVQAALKVSGGDADRAADWLFSHSGTGDLEEATATICSSGGNQAKPKPTIVAEDGDGKYQLCGMISHIGKNTGSGHYVCHLKKDENWVIFNDEKVAISSKPPLPHAYIYLYRRCDTSGLTGQGY